MKKGTATPIPQPSYMLKEIPLQKNLRKNGQGNCLNCSKLLMNSQEGCQTNLMISQTFMATYITSQNTWEYQKSYSTEAQALVQFQTSHNSTW